MARLTNPGAAELQPDLWLALLIGPTTDDPFSDDDLRVAWEAHGEELMDRDHPGWRPWGWWRFVAERPEELTDYPLADHFEEDRPVIEQAEVLEEWKMESIVWLARNGHLRRDEAAALQEEANEARLRVGTDAEQIGSGGVDRPDLLAVKLWDAVCEAMK